MSARSLLLAGLALAAGCSLLPGALSAAARGEAPVRPSSAAREVIVAADGTGDFKTVQAAVDAVLPKNPEPVTLHIRPGVYREQVTVPRGKTRIRFLGQDAAKTVLTYSLSARSPAAGGEVGTFNSASTFIYGDDFTAENVTFENASGNNGQALAIHVAADRATFRRCRFLGWQDTVLLNRGRQYFEGCMVAGHVDFIFGGATAFFRDCTLHARAPGYITAASTPEEHRHGFVFSGCRITADAPAGSIHLGRPWRPFASVAFLNTEMPAAIRPEGWDNWSDPARERTARFAEHRCTGPGAGRSRRVSWARELTDAEARDFTLERVLGGEDGWRPEIVSHASGPVTSTALAVALPTAAACPGPASGKQVKIVILGDSTVSDYPLSSNLRGWGQVIGSGFKEGVVVRNLAASGRSTRTFIAEGRLKKALEEKADFALIQFGHNDSHAKDRPEATEAEGDFKDYLRTYVDSFRKVGTQPILVTPMHRRTYRNGKPTDELKPYAEAMKAVAREKSVPVVDLWTASGELFERLGDAGSADLSCSPTDRTHFSEKGARAMAALVLVGLKQASLPLAAHLRAPVPGSE